MSLTAAKIAAYLAKYAAAFQQEYRRLTASPPSGGGYPALHVSPYLGPGGLDVVVSPDGVAICRFESEPLYEWVVGGAALLVNDLSRRPTPGAAHPRAKSLDDKNIRFYRVDSKVPLSSEIWSGSLGPFSEEEVSVAGPCEFRVRRTEMNCVEVLRRLTFGAFGCLLDLHLPGPEAPFWDPRIVERLGFVTVGGEHQRFVDYLELSPHVEAAAWDERAIATRVAADVRRDFGRAFSAANSESGGGSIAMGKGHQWVQPFFDRLSILETRLAEFANLLQTQPDADESVFHAFIQKHPILLDVYAEPIPKPRWPYPPGASPLGKGYVEPDFVLKYPDGSYRLVELERPAKNLATAKGEPRAGVNQAAFQIGEWRAYIANHYDLLKANYPGISVRPSATIVIGRSSVASVGQGRTLQQYKELLASQYQTIDILTYDELLERGRQAYTRLTSLAVGDP
jgi:Domain of unknown function (DUF4263)